MTSRLTERDLACLAGEHLDLVTDGWWAWDLDHPDYEYFSPSFWSSLGYDPEQWPNSPASWRAVIHPEDMRRALDLFERHMEDPSVTYRLLVRYYRADGGLAWIICRGHIVDGNDRRVMIGSHQNVSDLMRSDVQMDRTGERLSRSMDRILEALDGLRGGARGSIE